ncbi:MAG: DUF1156 domain-containing protein [Pirellulales bacterium]|nr:DUF1156 domain-containing protein [Pirellulales bacterium]
MATAETKTKKLQPWKDEGLKKDEWVARELAKAVNAGKAWDLETVDFADPNRPPTCLEVDFPIIPINEIATIEGNAGKPIYQMSKWWARRRSSVFRAMLLAAAIRAPDDPAEAAKLVWQVYYGNHQKKGAFKNLKVADIFMGGGTTVVEGSRLGMQMHGNDLNPIAWFVVKNELAQVDKAEVEAMLAEIEAEVKPQIMPFYACDCPRGHKGRWSQISTGNVMSADFDPMQLTPEERGQYRYEGPEIVHVFWTKHCPCQSVGCGHRTPLMSTPLMASKTLSLKVWKRTCKHCGKRYDLEEREARLAPSVELVTANTEPSFAVATLNAMGNPDSAICPHCDKPELFGSLAKPSRKTVSLSLLVHPDWIKGEPAMDESGRRYGGSPNDSPEDTIRWNTARASRCKLVEVRGPLPERIVLSDGTTIATGKAGGTVPKDGDFTCGSCGNAQDVRQATKAYGAVAPTASYALECFCPECKRNGQTDRLFIPASDANALNGALREWSRRSVSDLKDFWPREPINIGHEIGRHDVEDHKYTYWRFLFNHRQLLLHSLFLKTFASSRRPVAVRDYVLGAWQQYLRNQCMFSAWHVTKGHFAPAFSNSNFNPRPCVVEVGAFSPVGYGPWPSSIKSLFETIDWRSNPWERLPLTQLSEQYRNLGEFIATKSAAISTGDPVQSACITCDTSTDLRHIRDCEMDLVVTDPPFSNLEQYAEIADFFYVWLRCVLKTTYPDLFKEPETPKALEAVANKHRHPDDPEGFYQRLLTLCWKEAYRILKPSGLLAFTFHHSEDAPWVSVLESLFNAGFFLVSVFPIRGDESKGDGGYGSQKVEYDMIHVCRKRQDEPKPISWAKLRRQVLQDVRELQELLEHHQEEGLPEADLQVIRRGKALEYFSRHYGKVYKDQDLPMSVLEALLGINQLLDEEAGGIKDPPPSNAEPFTRMLLRLFDGKADLPRDQMQKFLRGTGSGPSDFADRGWVVERKKVFHLVPALEFAQKWVGKQRRGMTSDYDQAMYLIGACFEGSGINANDTLSNPNFRPHPALGAILAWFKTHGADSTVRNAATLASQLYRTWAGKNQAKADQLSLFDTLGEDDD